MRAFVTGATGFVGSHLVEALLGEGHEVTCLARDPAKLRRLFGEQAVRVVRGDLFDSSALEDGCRGADIIFHVAGLIAARRPSDFYAINRDATRRVVDAARRAAPHLQRLVYVSSLSAAGPSRRGQPLRETDPPHPVSEYGRSKLAGEEVVRAGEIPWTIVRPPTVYGPRDTETLRLFRFAAFGVMPLYGDPEQELSLVHARDLARALLAAAGPRCASGIYYACHPDIATSRETLAQIFRAARAATGRPPRPPRFLLIPRALTIAALWALGRAASLAGRATLLSADKVPELLAEAWTCIPQALEQDAGWRAAVDLESGLTDTARWYASHGWI